MGLDDADIISRVLNGDKEAFSELVEKYHKRLLNLAFRLVGDRGLAEDIGQEAFVRAYLHLAHFDEKRGVPFSAWLFTVTRNLAVDDLRRRIRRRAVSGPGPDGIDDVKDTSPDSLAALLDKEGRVALDGCLDQLPEPYQTTLRMQLEGKTLAQIAQGQGVAWGTVKSRLARARNALANLMRSHGDGS